MKRTVSFVLLVLFALSSCTFIPVDPQNSEKAMDYEYYNLKINKDYIHSENTSLYEYEYAMSDGTIKEVKEVLISLVDVVTYFGYSVIWKTDFTAEVSYDNEVYLLDTSTMTLIRQSDSRDVLADILANNSSLYEFLYEKMVKQKDLLVNYALLEDIMTALNISIIARSFEEYTEYKSDRVYIVTELTEEERENFNCVINGKKIYVDQVKTIYSNNEADNSSKSIYPVASLFKEIGLSVSWNNEDEATISYGSKSLKINLSKNTIEKNGRAIDPTEGLVGPESLYWTLYHQAHENDYYCTSTIVRYLLDYFLGLDVFVFDLEDILYVITDERVFAENN